MTKIITRFAPSLTGNLHIGSARTALINFICKSKNIDSKLYLRIDELGYKIKLSKKAKDFLADKGYDKKYGARPLKRTIQKLL